MKISMIAAVAQNNVIGDRGGIIWHIPGDLPRFKEITTGHHILMGKKTFESIGRVLPERNNLIISSDKNYKVPGAFVFQNPEEAVRFAEKNKETELMIIGGGTIYRLFLPKADKLYLTRVLKKFDGDTLFPEINKAEWNEKTVEEHPETDPPYEVVILERK